MLAPAFAVLLLAAGCQRSSTPVSTRATDHESHPAGGGPERTPTPLREGDAATGQASTREAMVRRTIEARGVADARVLAALRRVERDRFVPAAVRAEAYADRPLPIGWAQTISQPYIVAFMSEAARLQPGDRCLEVGTGSGYQAAVLAELCAEVWTIEYVPELARFGEANLRAAGYGPERVHVRAGDGWQGWPEAAPFDAILVTAAPDAVPPALLAQLAPGGRLVIPVGPQSENQELLRLTRGTASDGGSELTRESLLPVRFVPMVGGP